MSLKVGRTMDEESKHFDRMAGALLTRTERIALAEAALINHFKPYYNTVFKETDFSQGKKFKTLRSALREDLTGLIVEFNTWNLKARLGSEHRAHRDYPVLDFLQDGVNRILNEGKDAVPHQPMRDYLDEMRHAIYVTAPLTNSRERESFLHGQRWLGEDKKGDSA